MIGQTTTNNGSIVFRLRLAFGFIFVALLLFGLFSQGKFAEISARKNDLSQRAIPLLVRAQELVALLSTHSQQISTLRDIDTTADFEEIATIAAQRKDRFNESVARYQQLAADGGLQNAAELLFTSTDRLIDLQTRRQTIARQNEDRLSDLDAIVERMEITIEGLRLDVLTQLQSNTSRIGTAPTAADQIGPLSIQLNTLVSLGLLIEKMQDLAQSTRQSDTGINTGTMSENIRFVLRQTLGLLNRLDASPERTVLASDIVLARDMIFGANGIIQDARTYIDVRNAITSSVEDSLGRITDIETIIARTIAAADAGAQETSALLNASIRSLSISNLTTIAMLFGGLILVVVFLVELQLNRRIHSLRASARQLSVGNCDGEISVTGQDELGEVADSLRQSQTVSRDLKRSNADLKSFAYAASHDLKTPLRAITDLAEWTLEDASDELSDDNRQNLVLLASRSERLSSLLDGLLLYAQVDGMEDRNDMVDLAAECHGIADLLDPDGAFSVNVETTHPQFSTSVVPLRQILTNLMSNAMKHHDAARGRIDIRATITGNIAQIEVEDDGPGIPTQYHAKIFELFQKLESADVVEGAGIGLALVKKLSERHGGGVSLKSNQNNGRGSVFIVRLSVQARAKRDKKEPKS